MGVSPFIEHDMSFLKIHFLKELIIHRLHDTQRLSFNSSLAILIILSSPYSKFDFVSRAKKLKKGS